MSETDLKEVEKLELEVQRKQDILDRKRKAVERLHEIMEEERRLRETLESFNEDSFSGKQGGQRCYCQNSVWLFSTESAESTISTWEGLKELYCTNIPQLELQKHYNQLLLNMFDYYSSQVVIIVM